MLFHMKELFLELTDYMKLKQNYQICNICISKSPPVTDISNKSIFQKCKSLPTFSVQTGSQYDIIANTLDPSDPQSLTSTTPDSYHPLTPTP